MIIRFILTFISIFSVISLLAVEQSYSSDLKCVVERCKNGESDAYTEMAMHYREGSGGVCKSVLNAMACYHLAGIDPSDVVIRDCSNGIKDDFVTLNLLMDLMKKEGPDTVKILLEEIEKEDGWIEILRTITSLPSGDNLHDDILAMINKDLTADEILVASGSLFILCPDTPQSEMIDFAFLLADKTPYINNMLGEYYFMDYMKDNTKNESIRSAIECFKKAYNGGMLERKNSDMIISPAMKEHFNLNDYFSDTEIERFERMSNL